jgi:hypothetical protein
MILFRASACYRDFSWNILPDLKKRILGYIKLNPKFLEMEVTMKISQWLEVCV